MPLAVGPWRRCASPILRQNKNLVPYLAEETMARLPILSQDGAIIPVQALPPDPRNAQLSSRVPTLLEKTVDWLARNWYGDDREGTRKAERLVDVGRATIIGNVPFAAYDATRAAGEGRYGEAALNAAAVVAPFAGRFRAAQIARNAGPREAGRVGQRAVIRPDKVFRGHGVPMSSLKTTDKPYAIRVTGIDQIDDMVASGLVRPKPGGYGKQRVSTIYFGEADSPAGTTLFSKIDPGRARLVARSEDVANRKGPIPIDELKHVFVIRDGKEVDILGEILRRNKQYRGK